MKKKIISILVICFLLSLAIVNVENIEKIVNINIKTQNDEFKLPSVADKSTSMQPEENKVNSLNVLDKSSEPNAKVVIESEEIKGEAEIEDYSSEKELLDEVKQLSGPSADGSSSPYNSREVINDVNEKPKPRPSRIYGVVTEELILPEEDTDSSTLHTSTSPEICSSRCEAVNEFDSRVQQSDWVSCDPTCCWGDGPRPISAVCGYNSGMTTCDPRCKVYAVIPDPCEGHGKFVSCKHSCCGLESCDQDSDDPTPCPVGVQCGYCVPFDARPIPNATVIAYPDYPSIETLSADSKSVPLYYKTHTDENGNYELKLPAGCYRVEITKKEYEEDNKLVSVGFDESKELNFQLAKKVARISITSPSNGDIVIGTVDVDVSFSTWNYSPNKVEVRIDDGEWNEISCLIGCSIGCPSPDSNYSCISTCFGSGTYKWDSTQAQNGEHKIEARLHAGDYCVDDSIFVTVDNEDDIADYYYLDESDNGIPLHLKIGDRINLTLVTNPSTGYSWELDTFDESLLCLIDDYCWGYPQTPGLVGYSIKRTYIFEVTGSGHTTLQLKYWQPWSDHVAKTYIVDVFVLSFDPEDPPLLV